MSQPRARTSLAPGKEGISLVRTLMAIALVIAGIAWLTFYLTAVRDDGTPSVVADLKDWNFLIGFGVLFLGLVAASNHGTPLGRGTGVVVGMLGSFAIGLLWIVTYYLTSQDSSVPVMRELANYNLLVGIGFMAVGFVYATKWE